MDDTCFCCGKNIENNFLFKQFLSLFCSKKCEDEFFEEPVKEINDPTAYTVTKTGVRKSIWLFSDEAEALNLKASKERRSQSAIVREAIRRFVKEGD
jgi:hypothetical protein